jgi:hypothetical protein
MVVFDYSTWHATQLPFHSGALKKMQIGKALVAEELAAAVSYGPIVNGTRHALCSLALLVLTITLKK